MERDKVHDEPSIVEIEGETVRMKGPADVDVRFTPDAAEETSERLLDGAMKVRGQRYFEGDRDS
jgi:hypothetical protein